MRVAVGGIMQETNTFCAVPATLRDFAPYICRREAIISAYEHTRTPIGGFLNGAQQGDLTVVPTFFAHAVSSGLTERRAFEKLVGELTEAVQAVAPVDGVLLALHGAMAADGVPDADGEIARRIRAVVGPRVPIAVEVDLHGNVSARLVDSVDILVGYDTYPHVDIYDRGVEAALLLARTLRGEIRPVLALAAPPLLLVPQMQHTAQPPMRTLLEEAHRLEAKAPLLAVTVAGGFCYADVPHAGLTVVAMASEDRNRAREVAGQVAGLAWSRREDFNVRNISVPEAVARVRAATRGPVIMVDVGDNIGGGGPGDGTVLLKALLDGHISGALVVIADPQAVAHASEAGVGGTIRTPVGGKVDRRHGEPVLISGRVVRITDGRYVNKGSYMTGATVEMGQTAVVDAGGVALVLTERKTMPFDLEQIRSLGIEPAHCHIIVVKAAIAWRAAYDPIAKEVLEVDTPGVTSTDLSTFTFVHLRRPIYPLDLDRFPQEQVVDHSNRDRDG
jgi:microcystin degradation protein MlrC